MMKLSTHLAFPIRYRLLAGALLCVLVASCLFAFRAMADDGTVDAGQHFISLYDRGVEQGIVTETNTLREVFEQNHIEIGQNDLVEPGLDEQLVATSYQVNVYRARPVVVVDGPSTYKILSPHQTSKQIAEDAGVQLQDEDTTVVEPVTDMASHGAGLQVSIDRATPFTLVLYGKRIDAYTQDETVQAMLKSKNITLAANDTLSVQPTETIVSGMTVEIWRNGIQTITQEEEIVMPVEQIKDQDRDLGFREVRTTGKPGKKQVSYEINMQNGVEISRKVIQEVQTLAPVKQIEVIGAKASGNPLTKSKGVNNFVDSDGVAHRETYYDLPMATVMRNCNSQGLYTVRADGAKIDKDGYVIIAAHLANYPRCSVVETSLGLGKVYDTGGFTAKHPHGFDLATDWTDYNGR